MVLIEVMGSPLSKWTVALLACETSIFRLRKARLRARNYLLLVVEIVIALVSRRMLWNV